MKNKKALSWSVALGIIIALFTLILIFAKSSDFLNDANYESSILACKTMFSQIEGEPQYFGDDIKEPNPLLIDLIAKTCDAKQIKLKEKSVKPSLNLIKDCWAKSNEGINFFPSQLRDDGICLYCGSFKYESGSQNFKEELENEIYKEENKNLFESRGTTQLNDKILIDSIPQIIESDEEIHIFYYIMRPDYEKTFGSYFSDIVSSGGSYFTYANYFLQKNNLETFSGIILTSSENANSIINNAADSENIKEKTSGNCKYVIPKRIHS